MKGIRDGGRILCAKRGEWLEQGRRLFKWCTEGGKDLMGLDGGTGVGEEGLDI